MVSGATQPVGRDHRLLPIADALGGNKQGDVLFFGTVERFRLQRFKVQTSDSCQKKKKVQTSEEKTVSESVFSGVSQTSSTVSGLAFVRAQREKKNRNRP